jgi:transcriptional regulator with XRE-family HTH domain
MSLVIQKLRLQRGWSQQQLADFSGLSVRTVQRIESGQKATAESLKSLAAVFEVEFQELRAAVDEGSSQPSSAPAASTERPDPAAMNTDPVNPNPNPTTPNPTTPSPTTPPTPMPAPAFRAGWHDARHEYRGHRLAMSDDEVRAFREVRKLRGFYHHLMIYIVVIAGLTIFNLWKTPERLWVLGPALGWGIGILAHGLSVFGGGRIFGPEWERRQIEKRLGRKLALMLGAGFAFGLAMPGDVWAQAQARSMSTSAPSLGDILAHAPVWVWAVFVVLLVVGLRLSRTSTSRPAVSIVVSLGLLAWSLSGVVGAFGAHVLPLAAWAAGLVVAAALGRRMFAPDGLRLAAGGARVQVPGSWIPLIAMMGIFVLRFSNGVVTGAHLPLGANAAYAPVMAALLGACSGLFVARAWCIVGFARAQRVNVVRAVA